MKKFQRPRANRRDSKSQSENSPKSRGKKPFKKDFRHSRGNNQRDVTMTKVICSSCEKQCRVPFKPTSSKPVFCSDCFEKENNNGKKERSAKTSTHELDLINEKLNKIMKALKIE